MLYGAMACFKHVQLEAEAAAAPAASPKHVQLEAGAAPVPAASCDAGSSAEEGLSHVGAPGVEGSFSNMDCAATGMGFDDFLGL
eukprot:27387-Chlamydomonas_euryale.AAC.6